MWAHLVNSMIGIWLMASPAVFGHVEKPAEFNDRIVGPLIATFAIIAIAEITRSMRWVTFLAGLWLIPSAFFMEYFATGTANAVVCGLAVAGFSLVKGRTTTPFGGGWTVLWKRDPYGLRE